MGGCVGQLAYYFVCLFVHLFACLSVRLIVS